MTLHELARHCGGVAPELVLFAAICAVIGLDMTMPLARSRMVCGLLSLWSIAVAMAALVIMVIVRHNSGEIGISSFRDMLLHDQAGTFLALLFLVAAFVCTMMSLKSVETRSFRQGEYYSLLLGATLGALFLARSRSMLMFVLGFETISLCTYVLAGYLKKNRASAEASLKYVIYGCVTSGIMIFGLSYWYGLTHTLDLRAGGIILAQQGADSTLGFQVALCLILAGIGYKMSMVPVHFWCPDVYQGAPTPVTAFLATVSKAAGLAALVRLMLPFMEHHTGPFLPILFGVLAMFTMTLGNFTAVRQTDMKRMFGYSAIAHAGYLLMGFSAGTTGSAEAVLLYLLVYLFANLGVFWLFILVSNKSGSTHLDGFRGIGFRAPFLLVCTFLFLVSLTGLPPTAGFSAKLVLFGAVVKAGISEMGTNGAFAPLSAFHFAIVLVAMINTAVSLYYYMKIAKAMAFDKPVEGSDFTITVGDNVMVGVLAVPTLVFLHFAPILVLLRYLL